MKMTEYFEPRTHVIIEDFLTLEEQNKIWQEIKENESKFEAGLYKENNNEVVSKVKNNVGFIVNNVYPNMIDSHMRSMFHFKLFKNPECSNNFFEMKNPIYLLLLQNKIDDYTKVSAYGNEDYYNWHIDLLEKGLLTAVYMICKEPKKFTGGDFLIKWNNEEKIIPFKNNTLLVFARNTLHKVSEIKMESDKFYDRRFTVQCFVQTLF